MSRLRLIFVFSLVVLAGVFIATIYLLPGGKSLTESKRVQIIEGENEWILQYDLVNNGGREIEYTIHVTVDGAVHKESMLIRPGKTYTYIHHIYPQQLVEGKVTFTLYQEGKAKPMEQATYHIDFK